MRFLSEDLVRFFLRGPGMEIILGQGLVEVLEEELLVKSSQRPLRALVQVLERGSCGDPSEMASEVLA